MKKKEIAEYLLQCLTEKYGEPRYALEEIPKEKQLLHAWDDFCFDSTNIRILMLKKPSV